MNTTVALTLTQPWATLVVSGEKRIETRSWRTLHRGPLMIHAAKGFPRWAREICAEEPFRSVLRNAGYQSHEALPTGVILGGVVLSDCVPTDGIEAAGVSDQERTFGDYGAGRWAWLLDIPYECAEHHPMRGALGLWRIDGDAHPVASFGGR
jgi:hypothetical protein